MKEKGEAPVMFSHLGPVRRRATAEDEERVKHPRPEDSVYYHPTLNPSGTPPPGKPPMFKSSIGPRIPLPEASASNVASSSMSESDGATLSIPPLANAVPASFPLPPPPSVPPKPAMADNATSLPPPPLPLPPPPPGPPPKELLAPLPPRPPVHQSDEAPPADTIGIEKPIKQTI